jgi:hypothetical protein
MLNNLAKRFIKKYLPAVYQIIQGQKRKRTVRKKEQRIEKKSYGEENPDKIFYVIRWKGISPAFGGILNIVLSGIKYARQKGYIPVVDLKNEENYYLAKEKVGTTNVWEWFFEQPGGYTLADIARSKNVYLSPVDTTILSGFSNTWFENLTENAEALQWKKLFNEEVHLCCGFQQLLKTRKSDIIGSDDRAIGVKLRGTDYGAGFAGHPQLIPVDKSIEFIDDAIKKFQYTKIVLSCEDEKIVEKLKKRYGDKLVLGDSSPKERGEDQVIYALNDGYRDAFDYLSTLWLVSSCNAVYGVACGGTLVCWYLAKNNKDFFKLDYQGLN